VKPAQVGSPKLPFQIKSRARRELASLIGFGLAGPLVLGLDVLDWIAGDADKYLMQQVVMGIVMLLLAVMSAFQFRARVRLIADESGVSIKSGRDLNTYPWSRVSNFRVGTRRGRKVLRFDDIYGISASDDDLEEGEEAGVTITTVALDQSERNLQRAADFLNSVRQSRTEISI
jgi:hypothetical protein